MEPETRGILAGLTITAIALITVVGIICTYSNHRTKMFIEAGYEQVSVPASYETQWHKRKEPDAHNTPER